MLEHPNYLVRLWERKEISFCVGHCTPSHSFGDLAADLGTEDLVVQPWSYTLAVFHGFPEGFLERRILGASMLVWGGWLYTQATTMLLGYGVLCFFGVAWEG